jgi:2-amino-4-hydroxy-6-hydroxymethyldihydropteridine diphosphokinase
MATVFLGLGSNLGDRRGHLAHGLRRLDEELGVTQVSSVWETEPVGYHDQPRFLNMVVRVETQLGPGAVLEAARAIEEERDRVRGVPDGPRTLDIDVLLYGDRVVRQEGLKVPHPRMQDRPFVLVPLLELDPTAADPRTGEAFAGSPAASVPAGMERIMAGERLRNDDEA